MIEEPQVNLLVVSIGLEQGLELGDKRIQVRHYGGQYVQDVYDDFDYLIFKVPLQCSTVYFSYGPYALQYHVVPALVGLSILLFDGLKHR